ncbi:hypothetical protein [Enterobacter chuandaensis]|nr:hypothetical protein [Enterobacter chuandaensis]
MNIAGSLRVQSYRLGFAE